MSRRYVSALPLQTFCDPGLARDPHPPDGDTGRSAPGQFTTRQGTVRLSGLCVTQRGSLGGAEASPSPLDGEYHGKSATPLGAEGQDPTARRVVKSPAETRSGGGGGRTPVGRRALCSDRAHSPLLAHHHA